MGGGWHNKKRMACVETFLKALHLPKSVRRNVSAAKHAVRSSGLRWQIQGRQKSALKELSIPREQRRIGGKG